MGRGGGGDDDDDDDANLCVLQTVLVLKYVRPGVGFPALGFGISDVVANVLVMLRYVFSLILLLDLGAFWLTEE